MYLRLISICLSLTLTAIACKTDEATQPGSDSFDRKAMLQDYSTNYILPAYQELQTKVNAMNVAIGSFAANPNAQELLQAQVAWDEAYFVWQSAQHFNFGPAQSSLGDLSKIIGVFPVQSAMIESKIDSNNTTLDNFNFDTRGFLAIEYLLFSDSSQTILKFTSGRNAVSRKAYLLRTASEIKTRVDNVVLGWQTYKAEFENNTGTDVGSSTTTLFNCFVASYENLKNFKVGFPAGKRAGQTGIVPTNVEAYYSGRSVRFMKAHLTSIENIWLGVGHMIRVDGIGFADYIRSTPNGNVLIDSTLRQLTAVKTTMNMLPENVPLSVTLTQNFALVDASFMELQRQTRFFKSDMSSLLGLMITFSSNDGD
jgi:uncharacterized protein